jgi:type VI secretion system secreted protein Hcp
VVITNVQPAGSSSDEIISEQVSMAFSKVKQEYTVQNQQGGSGGAVTAGFDIKLNKEA